MGVTLLVLTITFFPYWLAEKRGVANTGMMFFVLLFLGWTGFGWLGCLLWAALGESKDKRAFSRTAPHRQETTPAAGRTDPHF